ncbi:hypothetical protein [Maricaulis sp.]|uniref:hypothetical protein n=1 Tax=Maricaulis sp. TaxID=1486257 RepID=UPI0025C36BD1|nr:hypothetical protein [Maricaulis sp.]
MSGLVTFLASLAAFTLSGSAVAMQEPGLDSEYTRIDEGCTTRQLPDEPVYETACPGHGTWTLDILTGEHGAAVAYVGPDGVRSEFVNAPMRGLYGGFHPVLEWRLEHGEAFATIHRYVHENPPELLDTMGGVAQPNTLIVTALAAEGGFTACPVAYIDASALPDANQIARDVTDRLSRGWDCGNEVIRFGADMESVDAYLATVRLK